MLHISLSYAIMTVCQQLFKKIYINVIVTLTAFNTIKFLQMKIESKTLQYLVFIRKIVFKSIKAKALSN